METLKQYVYKNLEMYDIDRQSTIKCVLQYLKADQVLANDYCLIYLNKSLEESNSSEIIKHMVLNSPWGFSYKEKNIVQETKNIKKRIISFNEDFDRDEIFND